jgi:hypothetical protein
LDVALNLSIPSMGLSSMPFHLALKLHTNGHSY